MNLREVHVRRRVPLAVGSPLPGLAPRVLPLVHGRDNGNVNDMRNGYISKTDNKGNTTRLSTSDNSKQRATINISNKP